MKQAKKTGGAGAYLKALNRSYIPRFKEGLSEILPVAVCAIAAFFIIWQARVPYDAADRLDFSAFVLIFAVVEFITVAIITSTPRHKPNLQSVFPMKREKKLALRLTGGLIYSLLWYVILLAALFVILAIPFLFMGIFINYWHGMLEYFEMYTYMLTETDGFGYAFLAFWVVLTYGAAVLCGTVKSNGLRWAVGGGYTLFALAFTLGSVNALKGGGGFVIRNAVIQNFGALPLNWLWLTAFILIACGLCAFAVIYACKQDKPKDF